MTDTPISALPDAAQIDNETLFPVSGGGVTVRASGLAVKTFAAGEQQDEPDVPEAGAQGPSAIGGLPPIDALTDDALFMVEQQGTAKKATGAQLKDFAGGGGGGGGETGGGTIIEAPDPMDVYRALRPSDWLPMPAPQDDEAYCLLLIPDGESVEFAYDVTCGAFDTVNHTIEAGTVRNGAFVSQQTVDRGDELFADDFGDLTSDGYKQVMIKISGTNITSFGPAWKDLPVYEVWCRLPNGAYASLAGCTRFFAWFGGNALDYAEELFYGYSHLIAVLELDTSKVTDMRSMFRGCSSLVSIPRLNTEKVRDMYRMFQGCSSLISIPELCTDGVYGMGSMFCGCTSLISIPKLNMDNNADVTDMFSGCVSLISVPSLNTENVFELSNMFYNCSSLIAIPRLNTRYIEYMDGAFSGCSSLRSLLLDPDVEDWDGVDIDLPSCAFDRLGLVQLFESLPTVTSQCTLDISGNPGAAALTAANKAIATGKGWTLQL